MTRVLNTGRREPVSGETRSCVVFLHGYGANGADLLGLADPMGEHLPDTLFFSQRTTHHIYKGFIRDFGDVVLILKRFPNNAN